MTQNTSLTPFRIDIPQDAVDDLHDRLTRTRWPLAVPGRDDRADFGRGVPLPYLKELAEYWREGFDWRRQEAMLNTHEQFTTVVDGQTFHVLHVRSANPAAAPLLISDSWPASFIEYQRLIPLLTDDFHVIIPSLPGLGFSNPLSATGWDLARTAEAYAEIMTRLGYARFATHGHRRRHRHHGTTCRDPPRTRHRHPLRQRPRMARAGRQHVPRARWPVRGGARPARGRTRRECCGTRLHRHAQPSTGHDRSGTHGLRPSASSRGSSRSSTRRIDGGHRAPEVDRDQLLANVSLYWFTRSGASVAQFFYESEHAQLDFVMPSGVPAGWAVFDTHPLIRRTMDPAGAIGTGASSPRVDTSRRWRSRSFSPMTSAGSSAVSPDRQRTSARVDQTATALIDACGRLPSCTRASLSITEKRRAPAVPTSLDRPIVRGRDGVRERFAVRPVEETDQQAPALAERTSGSREQGRQFIRTRVDQRVPGEHATE
jgi:hypothetical protein